MNAFHEASVVEPPAGLRDMELCQINDWLRRLEAETRRHDAGVAGQGRLAGCAETLGLIDLLKKERARRQPCK